MHKVVSLLFLFGFGAAATQIHKDDLPSKFIKRLTPLSKQNNNGIDWCPECVDTFDTLIYFVIDGIMELGIATTCNDLCNYVTQKSTNPYLSIICSVGCDIVGINEFIKIATDIDLDPIYFCEKLTLCPVFDNGDAKFLSFIIAPPHAQAYTKFVFDLSYQTFNGTGTGQMLVDVQTIDGIKVSSFYLIEAKKTGRYAERLSLDTTPDPDCESAVNPCEEWFPGVYNVTVKICNGECGSHHPHSQIYDTIQRTFQIDK
ncbi:unnamed protein product [Rotaria sp. Silwood2]|nr:unnamed protein product [Rotaria sp. Silwood2]CAF2867189.1 unnamed protein product [Rotaria sp. Silwood2]CAF3275038.1 unnamed protein product [Rotaria sp. Silwood2]CAF4079215.1 unnamed protein product [Rotaria sp. Silwood2]CAF4246420.1 unnamed protein product [Rotaria sp. Silwood2]